MNLPKPKKCKFSLSHFFETETVFLSPSLPWLKDITEKEDKAEFALKGSETKLQQTKKRKKNNLSQ